MNRPSWISLILIASAYLLFPAAGWSQGVKTARKLNAKGAVTAKLGEWPQWRGPGRDGISAEKGLLDHWPEEGPPLVWKVEGLGEGFSSVAIADGKIFTMGSSGDGVRLIARSVKDGQELWATPVADGSAPNSTPTVDGDLVFCLSHSGELACVKTDNGEVVWKTNFVQDFGGGVPGWGYSESPLVDGDRLIATPGSADAGIVAFDKRTGEIVWKAKLPQSIAGGGHGGAGYASVVISHGGGIKQYVQLMGGGAIGVAADTGRVLWEYPRIANGTANIPTPLIEGDFVFCSSGYGTGAALLQLSPKGDGVQAKELYFLSGDQMQNHHGGMILRDGYIYCGHGHNQGFPICIKMQTGKAAWGPSRGPGGGSAAVVYADGHFYFRYEDGIMALVEATPEKFVLKGKFEIASKLGQSWPHPVIAAGKLYLRDQDVLLCYDIRKKRG